MMSLKLWKTEYVSENGGPQKSLKSNFLSSMEVAIEFYAKFQAERHFYFLRGPPTFVWSLWKSKRKPLKWHDFLDFGRRRRFLPEVRWHRLANFMSKTEVAIEFYAKFWAGKRVVVFLKKFFFASPGKFSLFKDILSLFREGWRILTVRIC